MATFERPMLLYTEDDDDYARAVQTFSLRLVSAFDFRRFRTDSSHLALYASLAGRRRNLGDGWRYNDAILHGGSHFHCLSNEPNPVKIVQAVWKLGLFFCGAHPGLALSPLRNSSPV